MRKLQDNEFKHQSVAAGHRTPCHRPMTQFGRPYQQDADGYSKVVRSRAPLFAHRVRYQSAYGLVPLGQVLDHLCRNRWCCNPEHLEPVTPAVNVRRSATAKLDPAQVSAIRAMVTGGTTQVETARRFDIDASAVSRIMRGQQWADGPCPAWEIVKARRALLASGAKENVSFVTP